MTIAVEVSQHGSRGIEPGASAQAGVDSHVLKLPVAPVAIESAAAAKTAEKQIAPSVAVHVARGDTRAVQEDLIGIVARRWNYIREVDAGALRLQAGKSRSACGIRLDRCGAMTGLFGPIQWKSRGKSCKRKQQENPRQSEALCSGPVRHRERGGTLPNRSARREDS